MSKSLLKVISEKQSVFEITHQNSADQYRKFIMYMTVTRNLMFVLPAVLLLIGAGVAILYYAGALTGAIVIACSMLLPLFMILGAYFHATKYLKKNPWYLEYVNQYKFLSDVLYVCSDNKKRYSESVIAYENLHKIVETVFNFYIFLNKSQVVIIEKKKLDRDSYYKFKEFLLDKTEDGTMRMSLGFKIKKRKAKKNNDNDIIM